MLYFRTNSTELRAAMNNGFSLFEELGQEEGPDWIERYASLMTRGATSNLVRLASSGPENIDNV
jgi:hypothetical protein